MNRLIPIAALAVALTLPGEEVVAQERYVGAFLQFDLLSEDVDAAREFYGSMFGWTYEDRDGSVDILNNGRVIGTMHAHDANENVGESQWVGRMSVDDIEGATRFFSAAGRVHLGPVEEGRGAISVVEDPHGAVIALYRSHDGDELPETFDHGDWFWPELWTNDAAEAVAFYRDLVGYEARPLDDRYTVMRRDGHMLAGIGQAPVRVPAHWVPGVLVADLDDARRAVNTFGGSVLVDSSDEFGDGDSILAQDPTGAVFMLQTWAGGDR